MAAPLIDGVGTAAVAEEEVLRLNGVHHSARPTWKLEETVHFYRDVLGLPMVHAISARGWGSDPHPDFLHFFFDSGAGSLIAFFYYLGIEPSADAGRPRGRPWPQDFVFDATHTAWNVDTLEELLAWQNRLEEKGVEVSTTLAHEVLESIYFRDPNGYFLEISRQLRPLYKIDGTDAFETIETGIALERERAAQGKRIATIDEVWQAKGNRLLERLEAEALSRKIVLFVPNVDEFRPVIESVKASGAGTVSISPEGYSIIRSDVPLHFSRKALGVKPPIWYGIPTGGIVGKITLFDRDTLAIEPAE